MTNVMGKLRMNNPPPTPSPEGTDEPSDTVLERPRSWIAELVKLRTYFATRSVVREAIRSRTFTDISRVGRMGPWTFHLYQVALCAAPTIILGRAVEFVMPLKVAPSDAKRVGEVAARAGEIFPSVAEFLDPFLVPLLLFATCLVAARAALRPQDKTPANIRKSRDFYLYIDGALGLLPKTLVTLTLWLALEISIRGGGNGLLLSCLGWFLFVSFNWLTYVSLVKVPTALLSANGYDPGRGRFFGFGKNRDNPLFNKYQMKMGFAGLLIILPLWLVFVLLEDLIAYALASFQVWAQHLV
jgi:hypothetical protein